MDGKLGFFRHSVESDFLALWQQQINECSFRYKCGAPHSFDFPLPIIIVDDIRSTNRHLTTYSKLGNEITSEWWPEVKVSRRSGSVCGDAYGYRH